MIIFIIIIHRAYLSFMCISNFCLCITNSTTLANFSKTAFDKTSDKNLHHEMLSIEHLLLIELFSWHPLRHFPQCKEVVCGE